MKLEEIVFSRASEADLSEVEVLLRDCTLPTEGLADHWQSLILARTVVGIAGCAAVELYGGEGLLRSVAVRPAFRGLGLGQRLTRRALQVAGNHGVTRVYLLTETAENYFPRFGFAPVERGEVPDSVKKSAEFSGACPETALAMVLDL